MAELSFDNVLDASDVDNLFTEYNEDDSNINEESNEEQNESSEEDSDNEETDSHTTTEVDSQELFDEDEPESVGSEDEEDINQEMEDTIDENDGSPNVYSLLAKTFQEDGVFPDLDENIEVNDAESFKRLIDNQIREGIDNANKRMYDALNANVSTDVVKQYENTIRQLDAINEEHITSEDEQSSNLRKQLIYQDYLNRGYSQERAAREVKKSVDSGSDIEDAKDALESAKRFYNEQYNGIIEQHQQQNEIIKKQQQEEAKNLQDSILTDKQAFNDLIVNKTTRKAIYDNLTQPVYKDEETGNYLTAIQKYQKENKIDFLKNLGLVFTLTDGFKNMDGLVKNKVKKETSKAFKKLENTLKSSYRGGSGNLSLMTGVGDTDTSKGWSIDI